MNKSAFHFLRVGLAVTFLWIGVLILRDPIGWGAFIQPWALALLPGSVISMMIGTAILDILIGIFLLLDIYTWVAAAIGAAHIAVVLVTAGITDVTVRDIGLIVAAIALFIDSFPRKHPG